MANPWDVVNVTDSDEDETDIQDPWAVVSVDPWEVTSQDPVEAEPPQAATPAISTEPVAEASGNLDRMTTRLSEMSKKSAAGLGAIASEQDPSLRGLGTDLLKTLANAKWYSPVGMPVVDYIGSVMTKGYVEIADLFTPGNVREDLKQANKEITAEADKILGSPEMQYEGNTFEKYAWEVGEATVNMGPALLVGWATKNPGLSFAVISGQVGGSKYNDYMTKTGDHDRAMAAAKFNVLAEVIPETLPVMAILRKTGAGQATRRLLEATLGEGFQEGLTEILQNSYDDVELKNMTLGEALKNIDWGKVGHAALVGMGVGGVLSTPGVTGDILAGREAKKEESAIQDAFMPDFKIKPVEENATAISDILDTMVPSAAQMQMDETGQILPVDQTTLEMKPVTVGLETELGMRPVTETLGPEPVAAEPDRILDPKGLHWRSPKNADLYRKNAGLSEDYSPVEESPGNWALHKVDEQRAAQEPLAEKPGKIPTAEELDVAAQQAAASPLNDKLEPSESQIEADNYAKGHIGYDGLKISIENPAGSKRKPEWPELAHHYGDIKGTEAADGDPVDVYLNKDNTPEDTPVFIIDQLTKEGKYDEAKVMLGFRTQDEAIKGYMDNFTPDWHAPDNVSQVTVPEFKEWLKTGDTKKPYVPIISRETMTAEQRQAEIEGTLSTEEDIVETAKAERRMVQSQQATTRTRQNLAPDSENDDLATYIRKLGGIDTDTESDARGRLSHLNANNQILGLPSIEQKGGKGMTLDALGENLIASGYLKADPTIGNGVDKDALLDLLFEMEGGEPVMSISAQDRVAREKYDEGLEEAQKVWEAQQEVEELEQLRTELDAMENISPDLDRHKIARLLDQANDVSEQRTEDILSKDIPDADVVKLLEDMINEDRKPAKKDRLESIAESDQEVSQPQKVEQTEARQEELRLAEESKPSQEKEAMVDPIKPGTAKESQESLEIPTIQEEKLSEKQEQAEKKAVEAQAAEEIAKPERRAEGGDRQERRVDTGGRKRVSEMTPEEMSSALLTNEKSGLKNERAYEEDDRLDYQSFFDIDNFKEINTQYTYDGADKILTAFGDVIQKAEMDGVVAYHLHGDEFIVQSNSEKDLKAFSDKIQENLYSMEIVIDLPGIDIKTATSVGASYGIGKTKEKAESNLKKDKEARAKAGLRSEREREPGAVPEETVEDRPAKDTRGEVKEPRKASSRDVSTNLDATKKPTKGEYPALKDIELKMDADGDVLANSAEYWLNDIDSRIKEVNKLRDCI